MSVAFNGDNECNDTDQIVSGLVFALFLSSPIIINGVKWYRSNNRCANKYKVFRDTLNSVSISALLMLSVDLRPFSCLMENTVGFQITIIAVGIVCFVLHVTLSKMHKDEDNQGEDNGSKSNAHSYRTVPQDSACKGLDA